MKVAVVGYGAMGKTVKDCLKDSPFEIAGTIDPFNPEADFQKTDADSMRNCDVCICFSTPDSAMDNIREISAFGKDIVMATTGWLDRLDEAKQIIERSGNGLVYSSNFSIGVNLFFRLIEFVAKSFNPFPDYDIFGYEIHHKRKRDSPSGTAKTLENIILENFTRKQKVTEDRLNRRIKDEEFHFASVRGGDVPGIHTIHFESEHDSIELKHTARNRNGFAKGAIIAANWIHGQKGVFTEKEVMQALLVDQIFFR